MFGVRWRFWVGSSLALALLTSLPRRPERDRSLVATQIPVAPQATPAGFSGRESTLTSVGFVSEFEAQSWDLGVFAVLPLNIESRSIPELISDLQSSDRQVRIRAVTELSRGSIFAFPAIPLLSDLANNESEGEIRELALRALYNIRGNDPAPRRLVSPGF
jgi:hypothetical protein